MATMTIARGLARIKTANAQIKDTISQIQSFAAWNSQQKCPLTDTKKDLKTNHNESAKEVMRLHQQFIDLTNLIVAIKIGIEKANLTTTMEISGKTLTIAEALIYQRNIYDYMRSLYNSVNYSIQTVSKDVDTYNAPIMANPNYDEGKRKELIASISYFFPYDENKKNQAFCSEFITEINGRLNEINAITEIEIPD